MINVIHDKGGKVVAYVDYDIVNKDGSWNNYGEYCFVRYIWKHRSLKKKGILQDFVEQEHMKFPTVKWIYYERNDRINKKMRIFNITRFYRKEKRNGNR